MSQNLWVLIGKGIAKKIHCCFAVFILLTFVGAAHAAGYTCPSSKKYTSCNSGYYMNGTGAGNSCTSCTTVSATDLSQSCTRNPTTTELSNAHAKAGTISGARQKCTGKHTGGAGGTNGVGSCSGCSSWGSCSGGTLTITTCSAGYYKDGNSCVACGGNNYYCPGDNTRKNVSSGYYSTGGTSTTRTGQRQCTGATYCSGGVQKDCPSQTSGWTRNGGTGWTSYTQCNQTRAATSVSSYCSSGTVKQNATSATKWGTTTVSSTLYAKTGSYVSGTTCNQCPAGYRCPGGTAARSACSGSLEYQNAVGQSACKTVSSGYYKASNSAQRECPLGYRDGTAAANISSCKMDVEAGHYVGTKNSSTQSTCAAGSFKAAHTVSYGSTSSCSTCSGRTKYSTAGAASCSTVSAGYYTTGCNTSGNACTGQSQCTGATYCSGGVQNNCPSGYDDDLTARKVTNTQCQIRVAGGRYIGTRNSSTVSLCDKGYYKASHMVSYGNTSSCSACSGRAKYTDTTGSTSCKNVLAGYYTTGCKAGNIACTGQSRCTGATYCSRGVQNSCPTIYTDDTTAGKTAANQCQVRTDGGYYIAAAQDDEQTQCTTKHYCPSALVSYGSTNSPTACPSGYPNSAAGASVITQCYSNTKSRPWTGSQNACTKPSGCSTVTCNTCSKSACNYVAYANSAGTGDGTIKSGCSMNNESCNQTVKSVTANAGYRVNGTACTQCTGATYSAGGTATSCSNCPTIYTDNTTAGKSSASQCQVRTDAGYYIAAPRDDEQTGCPMDSFCTSALVNYGSTNAPEKCPDAATHIMTTYPSNYYDVQTITNKNQTWGYEHKKSSSECLATYYGTNERGNFNVESVGYNPDTGKYDRGGSMYYGSISPGYYAEDKFNDTYCDDGTHRMYYRDAKPCPADSYCPGFTSMPLCSSGEYTETNGINACPSGYLDNEELRKTAISQCQREVSSKVYIATAGGTTPSICPAGSACPGGMLGYGDIGPINKCTGATYSLDSSASCSDCPAGYDDDLSDGKTRQTACKISVPAGDYMDVPGGTTIKECTTKHYCPGGMVGYGSKLEPTACPDPETHLTTEYPDSYYDAKFSVISVQAWFTGGEPWTKETDCRAVYSLDNSRGHLIADNVVYNASTQKYDQFIRWPYYVSINPGYYASSKYDEATCDYDNNTMLYKDAQPCPAGSYCPGLTSMPSCTSGTYNDTLGINACPANYGASPAQSTANTQCYLTTTAGKWVATKNAAQTSCTAGGFCVGGVKVNYGSTGGRTPAAAGYYVSATGATTQTACAAGTYTYTTGQTKCTDAVAGTYTTGCKITSNNTACTGTAVCATNTYSDARASVCIACNTTNGYKNIGTDKSAHAGIASCKVYCSDGEYVPVAGDGCVDVGVGYWGVGGGVAQNATLARNACASGLTTIGFGLGANEAGDCGRVLNVGDEKIYLRSTKKTTPSLNISINGDVFYGNMSTATSGGSSLRINSGGATYRVYDDSNPALSHSGGDLD